MRKLVFATLLATGFAFVPDARAEGLPGHPSTGPFSNRPKTYFLGPFSRGGQGLPVFQAAPWYLYWPYDAHFLTPAPIGGAYYAPPMGYYPIQPFFPRPMYGNSGMPYGVPYSGIPADSTGVLPVPSTSPAAVQPPVELPSGK